jgi:flotillin
MIVTGGGRVLVPLFESYLELPTTAFQVPIEEKNIPNKDNVKMTVGGVATCKVSSDEAGLNKAIEALIDTLTKTGVNPSGKEPLEEFVLNILKGHLRSIIGQLDINQLLRERDQFNQRALTESKVELSEFGISLMNLVIQDINDNEGYIDALGRRAVADARADAEIKVAEAQKNQDIQVSNAQRDASLVKAENEAKVAEANKDRDVKQAAYKQEADTKKAEADMAFSIAQTAQEQTLQVAQAERDAASRSAQIEVQKKEAERRTAELKATVVAQAAADKEKSIIDAEANKQKRIIEAEAEAQSLTTTAEARKNAATLEGEGEANKLKATLLAEAEGNAAQKGQALLAEAEGTKALAAALKEMDESARFMLLIDKLPGLLEKGGDAGEKIARAIFESVAAPMGNIDSINIVDFGGGNGAGGMGQLSSIVPKTVVEVFAKLSAAGIDPSKLLSVLGIDMSQAQSLLGNLTPGGGKNGGGNGASSKPSHTASLPPAAPAAEERASSDEADDAESSIS